MPIFTVGAAGTTSTGFDVTRGIRFADNAYQSRTPGSAGNQRIFTISVWVKLSEITTGTQYFIGAANAGNNYALLRYENYNFEWIAYDNGAQVSYLRTTAQYKDPSAWYHIVIASDTTQSTAANRTKMYVNGVQITNFQTENYPSQNADYEYNNSLAHTFGAFSDGASSQGGFFEGYMCEIVSIDGQQLTPTSFGEFESNSGIWQPIDPSGLTFGTNGFYLNFETQATDAVDASGNGNNFTSTNVVSTDHTLDTPMNNYATLNPLTTYNSSYSFANGNLDATSSTSWLGSVGNLGVSAGKWYWEVKYVSGNFGTGIAKVNTSATSIANLSTPNSGYSGKYPDGYEYFKNFSNSQKLNNNSSSSYGSVISANDILMVAFDADNGTIWVGNNGTWFNSATQSEIEAGTTTNAMYSGITVDDFFVPTASIENGQLNFNFGSPTYAISSSNSDGNGHGNFEYAVPSGYYALNTKNLAEFG